MKVVSNLAAKIQNIFSECECETNLMKSEVSLHDGHLLKFNRLYFVFLEETAGNVKLNNYES